MNALILVADHDGISLVSVTIWDSHTLILVTHLYLTETDLRKDILQNQTVFKQKGTEVKLWFTKDN